MVRSLPLFLILAGCPSPEDESGDTAVAATCEVGFIEEAWGCVYDCANDVAALSSGLVPVDVGTSLPANLVAFGDRSCPTLLDGDGRVLAASARSAEGRVWVAGHESYLDSGMGQTAIRWAADGGTLAQASASLTSVAQGSGLEVVPLDLSRLEDVSVVVLDASTDLSSADQGLLSDFVRGGGGLVTAGQAWWWASNHDEAAAEGYPANAWLSDVGIVITAEPSWSAAVDAPLREPAPAWMHHRHALSGMKAVFESATVWDLETQRTAVQTSLFALDHLPLSRVDYYDVAIPYSDAVGPVVPTEAAPIDATTQLPEVLAARVQGKLFSELPADEVEAYSGVADFPGAVVTTDRVTRTVSVLASYDGRDSDYVYSGAGSDVWRSTGLYAAPGEVVTLTVPSSLADSGVSVRIGPWTDRLWDNDSWSRFPEISRSQAVDADVVAVASAFGGPIYLQVPAGTDLGPLDVEVAGAVEMAHYVHGQTAWADVRSHPAPWAELESDRLAITVPASELGFVSDASALMDFWDSVLGGMSALEGSSVARPRAERFVVDRQISAGWMHSGYPIMAHLESAEEVLDLGELTVTAAWGPFHELGHNHQYSPWILPGTTETTCNLFSVYASENQAGVDRGLAHSALAPAERQARIDAFVAGGRDFADWSVWTALETYLQLQEAFGWQFYTDVFTTYRSLPSDVRVDTDQARIDTWVEVTSEVANVDLGPFYLAWGFPVSQSTLDTVGQRPAWVDDPMNP